MQKLPVTIEQRPQEADAKTNHQPAIANKRTAAIQTPARLGHQMQAPSFHRQSLAAGPKTHAIHAEHCQQVRLKCELPHRSARLRQHPDDQKPGDKQPGQHQQGLINQCGQTPAQAGQHVRSRACRGTICICHNVAHVNGSAPAKTWGIRHGARNHTPRPPVGQAQHQDCIGESKCVESAVSEI